MSKKSVSRVGLDTIFNIAKAWGLNENEEAAILGQPDLEALRDWKIECEPQIGNETILRMSYILGIFRAIDTLLQFLNAPTHGCASRTRRPSSAAAARLIE